MQLFMCTILLAGVVMVTEAREKVAGVVPGPDCALVQCAYPTCPDGREPITLPGQCCPTCPRSKGCFYKGKFYTDGQRFKDDCNSCWCSNGSVGCTKIGCLSKPGSCPKFPGMVGICVEECNGDSSCPGDQKCCSNGCGHTCQNPVGLTPGCYRGGRRYDQGDSVPSKNHCETCTCLGGKITCTPIMCPMVMCLGRSYTPPGRCCPICRPGGDYRLE